MDLVRGTARGGKFVTDWSVGARRGGIARGDRAFLLRQHRERGIIAAAEFIHAEVWEGPHWIDPKRTAFCADIRWLRVLPRDDGLDIAELKRRVPRPVWDRMQGSGGQLDDADGQLLERVWQEHVGRAGSVTVYPDELPGGTYEEGEVARVKVNRYERDPLARAACLRHWGHDCSVCGINFGDAYGPAGEGFIHVHHLHPMASSGGRRRKVDPVRDLRPVCPNCHAMLHRRPRLRTVRELRREMRDQE